MKTKELKNKDILIIGFRKEGKDTLAFLRKRFPKKEIGIADEKEKGIRRAPNLKLHLGKNYLKAIKDYDLLFATAGLRPENLNRIRKNLKRGQVLTSQDKFFLENCPAPVIGVTGTKGKGTTASLIHAILKKAGKKTLVVGNIGQGRLTRLDKISSEHLIVQEFSARQLRLIQKSPHIAVFLNFYPAHLDFYENLDAYRQAKQRIALFQNENDYFIYNRDQKTVRETARKSKGQKISFGLKSKGQGYVRNRALFWKKEKIMEVKEVPLPGRFNLYNALAAVCVGRTLQIPAKTIKGAIREFEPLPHRLEKIGEYKGIIFYNDSLATVPQATERAMETFGSEVQTLLAGGYEAGQDFTALAGKISDSNIKNLILFPPTGQRIARKVKGASEKSCPIRFFNAKNMKEAVAFCYRHTEPGKIVLLSPASPSFGLFKNYKERGELFKKLVRKYGRKKKN